MNFNEGMNSGLDFATFMNSALRNNDDNMWAKMAVGFGFSY